MLGATFAPCSVKHVDGQGGFSVGSVTHYRGSVDVGGLVIVLVLAKFQDGWVGFGHVPWAVSVVFDSLWFRAEDSLSTRVNRGDELDAFFFQLQFLQAGNKWGVDGCNNHGFVSGRGFGEDTGADPGQRRQSLQ